MAFNDNDYRGMYKRFLGPLAQDILCLKNNGTGFDEHSGAVAHVSMYREDELVNDGTMRLGDLKLIVLYESLPVEAQDMTLKDRIVIDGKYYSIIKWDVNTRSIGADPIAVEATIRGGGTYT